MPKKLKQKNNDEQINDIVIENFQSYKGNPTLKKRDVKVNWTPELLEEYMKCANDIEYFAQKYIKIITLDKGLVPFKPYEYQKKMLDIMAKNKYSIFACARQSGKTITTCTFILWYILFNTEKTVAILANKGDTSREILNRVQIAYQNLPSWLQQGVLEWNKGSLVLENNSRVIAAPTTSSSIRGYTINVLFIDECAFVENWDEFFTSVFPTISSGNDTKIILVSTPNGLNHFYKIWHLANKGENGYVPYLVTWRDVPGRDENWKQITLAGMNFDIEKFQQEYEVTFLGTANTLINTGKLKQLVGEMPIASTDYIKQYKKPEKDNMYVMIADTARGRGNDYSAFSVIDVTTMPYVQVCTFRDNLILPADYAEIINRIGRSYNDAYLLLELNDLGNQVADLLHMDYEYPNMIYTEKMVGRYGKRATGPGSSKNLEKGITTSKTVKSVGCSLLKLLIENNQLIINDSETIKELITFSRKGQSFEAESGHHDDLVMGLVLFAWLTDQDYFKEITNINTFANLRKKSEDDITTEMLPFGFLDRGITLEEINQNPFLAKEFYFEDEEEIYNF